MLIYIYCSTISDVLAGKLHSKFITKTLGKKVWLNQLHSWYGRFAG